MTEQAYASGWYAATAAAAEEPRMLAGDVDADVCIVGGGIAGLTVARELARRDWSVVLLEAQRLGAGAAGSGAGIVRPGFAEPVARTVERVGIDDAKSLWKLSAAGAAYVRAAIAEAGMAGTEPVAGHLAVQLRDDADAARDAAAFLRQVLATDAQVWPQERVRALLRSGLHHQAIYLPDAFHIQPLNYALGLAADARRAGARLYEDSPARAVDASGVRKRVETERGRVRARHVVLAASRGNQALHPALAGTLITLRRPMGVTIGLGAALAEAVRFAGSVTHGHALGRGHRIVAGDRLLWCGPLGGAARPGVLRRQVRRIYPQLREVAIAHAWSAPADYAVHRMPQIGALTPGLWVAGGFGRDGIAAAAMAGDLIARAIHEGDDRWRLFQPYGLVWTAGFLGRAVTALALRAARARLRLHDALGERYRAPRPAAAPAPAAPAPLPPFPLEADAARRKHRERRAEAIIAATTAPR